MTRQFTSKELRFVPSQFKEKGSAGPKEDRASANDATKNIDTLLSAVVRSG